MGLNQTKLANLRRELHKNPELSNSEKQTTQRIKNYIMQYKPDDFIEGLGGYGIAFVFKGLQNGPSVMFRCELDALPIDEINHFSHQSLKHGVSHKCGHDGHMTIMAGLAELLSNYPPKKGRVILLFQPSEETGQGAKHVIEDPKFESIKPDYIFALHNLPGFPKNKILFKDGVFSSASIGLIVRLTGKTSHASEPEKGSNPIFVMATIIKKLEKYAFPGISPERIKIITPIYTKLGEKAFGTNPGYAEMMFTLRATFPEDFENLKEFTLESIQKSIQNIAPMQKPFMEYEWVEEFPNTENETTCNNIVLKAAKQSQYSIEKLLFPFRWSEDFGHFLAKYPGTLFGLGSGTDHPALHNPDYDFPDDIIKTGIDIFYNIIKTMCM